MDERWLRWVNELLPALKAGNLEEKIWNFENLQQQNCSKNSNRHFGPQRHDNVPNAPLRSQRRSGAEYQNHAKGATTRSVESVQQCHKIRQKQSSGGRLPLSPVPTPKQVGNTRATCRGFADKATASPAAFKRMTGKFLLDVFGGSGCPSKNNESFGFA